MFKLKELARWLGMTVFEMFVHLISITLFSVMVVLKLDRAFDVSWWTVFVSLFICDGLNAYFCVIVFIRQYIEGVYKAGAFRALWSFMQLLLMFLFKLLLCLKAEGQKSGLVYSEVFAPLFILLMLVMVRACHLH
ncbi:transmembrane protein 203 [Amblyomma americanum]